MINSKHIVEVLLENFSTIGIKFEPMGKTYTYKVEKGHDIEVGDKVIVITTSEFKCVDVVRVDEVAQIDVSASYQYKFIIQKVDLTQYAKLLELDEKVRDAVVQTERVKLKKDMLEQFVGSYTNEDVKQLTDQCKELGIDLKL